MWHDNILGTIGNTPLVRLNRLFADTPATVLAKVEYLSPGGSVKDRIAVGMIDAAEQEGRLKPGGTIIEGTRGNTGAGLALVAIARGYRCIFTTTDKQSQEKIDVLRAFGAEVIVCPTNVASDDPKSYYSVARRLATEIPNSVYLNQYDNPANAEAHYLTTGPELWEQTEGRISHFISGAGTGGTISGATRYLKEQNPEVQVVGVDPFGSVYYKYFHTGEFDDREIYPYLTEGVGEDILAKNMDFGIIDDYVRVTDRESMLMTRRLAAEEGLFVGQSSGMVVAGALDWVNAHADEITESSVIVILLPDSGFRYLSKTYNDGWMRDHGFLETRSALTVEDVLKCRKDRPTLVSVAPTDTVGHAIDQMAKLSISQLPVMDEGEVVGSLTESGILSRLILSPTARDEQVASVMGAPLSVVARTLNLEHLATILDSGVGAVLVEGTERGHYDILTKSDVIAALARLSRNGRRN
jgi:cystathionine beta-synthase